MNNTPSNLDGGYVDDKVWKLTEIIEFRDFGDTRGNLSGDGKFAYSHDWQNRLTSVMNSSVNVNYLYDGGGRQRQKSVGGQVTNYVYDGSNLVVTYDTNMSLTSRYIYGPGVDEPVVRYDSSGKTFLHADERGSIIAETSSTGALIRRYSYGPYGEVDNPAPGSIFRFTGQRYDSETNLYYYKARTYSAALGRFLEPDPIGTDGGINIYAYAGNDPINKKDPTGLDSCFTSPDAVFTTDPIILDDGTVIDGFTTTIPGTTVCLPDPPPLNDPCADPNTICVTGNPNNGSGIKAPPNTNNNDPFFTSIGFTPGVGGVSGNGTDANSTNQCMQAIAYTPQGDTKGENPVFGGGGYNTDLPGSSLLDAAAVYDGLTLLAGDKSSQAFPDIRRPNILLRSSPSGIQFRLGEDLRYRIDIPANTFQLRAPETIHFRGGEGNMCPTR